jgi:hypothetical protein
MWVDWTRLAIEPTLTPEDIERRAYVFAIQNGMSKKAARYLIFGDEKEPEAKSDGRFGARHHGSKSWAVDYDRNAARRRRRAAA